MKVIFLKVILLVLICMVGVRSFALNGEVNGLYYYFWHKSARIESGKNYTGDLVIPNSVRYQGSTYNVISISNSAFSGNTKLTSVSIPSSITSIGVGAFSGCTSLETISVSENNPIYDSREGCNSIIEKNSNRLIVGCKKSTIPNDVVGIGDYAFQGCNELTSITIPDSVTSIGKYSFYGCSGLKSISFSNNLITIGDEAFSNCSDLSLITIPSGVTSISSNSFCGCAGLTTIRVDEGNSIYDSRNNCNAIIETNNNRLIVGCVNTTILSSVNAIGENAFYGCTGLTSIDIPNSITTIGSGAFYGCSSLNSITIPNSVTSIEGNPFSECNSIQSLTIGVSDIGSWFNGNTSLTSLSLSEGVINIGNGAFSGCSSLTSVDIPYGVTNIGNSAFQDCTGLTSISIPCSVINIGESAFLRCGSIVSLTIPNGVTSIGNNAFQNCSSLSSIIIPNSVTHFGEFALRDCNNLKTMEIGMTIIPSYKSGDFYYSCFPGSLTDVTLLDGVTTIEKYAFSGCTKLTTIIFPNSLKEIDNYVFNNCYALNDVTIPSSVTTIATDAFSGCKGLSSINIGMKEVSSFMAGNEALRAVTLLDGVTTIGGGAFYNCSNLNSITISTSVKTIGNNSFSKCTGLVSIDIPNSVTTIESNAFEGCSGLTAFNLPESVTNIGDGAFLNCISLDSINIPNSVTRIGACAFQNCKNLVSFEIPNSVSGIEYQTFMGCSQLSAINIPNSVSKIYARAFKDCESLTSVSLPNSITIIETEAYFGCSRLTSVEIDRSTPINIDGNTFSNRENATLFVPAGSEEAYKSAKYWMEFKAIKTLNNDVPVTGLSLDETNISLSQIGDTHQLKAIIEPSNATNKTINWNSSNFAVCIVTETGLVIAKGCGKANIVATTVDGGYTATCEVTVTQPVEALALEKHSLTLKIGETERLYVQIAPLLASNKTVNWSSADEEVAIVDSMGTVKALAAGETWIMAVSDDNPEAKDSCIVIVPDTPAPAPNGECATPVIIASGNKITFECETPDAEFTSYLTASEEISGNEVVIENKDRTYTLTVYATAPGYDRSKPATMKIIFKNGDMNLDGVVNLADITTLIKVIAGQK